MKKALSNLIDKCEKRANDEYRYALRKQLLDISSEDDAEEIIRVLRTARLGEMHYYLARSEEPHDEVRQFAWLFMTLLSHIYDTGKKDEFITHVKVLLED